MAVFVEGGPQVPERLLQLHEEGRVVFFTGAGTSVPAGLPNFKNLLKMTISRLKFNGDEILNLVEECKTCNQPGEMLDRAFSKLEDEYRSGRAGVRKAVAEILTPVVPESKLKTHKALLELSKTKSGKTRLVTTNYDRLFNQALQGAKDIPSFYAAPVLPVPKKRWEGITYLHGFLKDNYSDEDLQSLVLSSGDFGLAYLQERWAARFVTELFKNFIVCFVGYSIDDPVLRYITDSLAADAARGEKPTEVFAFAAYTQKQRENDLAKWRDKKVIPIGYDQGPDGQHKLLHATLQAWAECYRTGSSGKQMIVLREAVKDPSSEDFDHDSSVSSLLWALQDTVAAKTFSELIPPASFEWIEALSKPSYSFNECMGCDCTAPEFKEQLFGLVNRPVGPKSQGTAGIMTSQSPNWDKTLLYLGRWLAQHVANPKLLLWLADQTGEISPQFIRLVKEELIRLTNPVEETDIQRRAQIESNHREFLPSQAILKLWHLVFSGLLATRGGGFSFDFYRFFRDFETDFETDSLAVGTRSDLRQLLSVKVEIRKPIRLPGNEGQTKKIRDLVSHELKLSGGRIPVYIQGGGDYPLWEEYSYKFFSDVDVALQEALEIWRFMSEDTVIASLTSWILPSISDHSQNSRREEWTDLVLLCRDAWLSLSNKEPEQAVAQLRRWWALGKSELLYRRLALFGATCSELVDADQIIEWLFADRCMALWHIDLRREVSRTLVTLGGRLDTAQLKRVEDAILNLPEVPEAKTTVEEQLTWFSKLDHSLSRFSNSTKIWIEQAIKKTDWTAPDESDEIFMWMEIRSSSAQPPSPEPHTFVDENDLVSWILDTKDKVDNKDLAVWECIVQKNLEMVRNALIVVTKQGFWPVPYWQTFLYSFSNSDKDLVTVLGQAPEEFFDKARYGIARFMLQLASNDEDMLPKTYYLKVLSRIFDLRYPEVEISRSGLINASLNHPLGIAAEALLLFWRKSKPPLDGGLSNGYRGLFGKICRDNCLVNQFSLVHFGLNLVWLFKVDSRWSEKNLFPLLNWSVNPCQANALWTGFLRAMLRFPRLQKQVSDYFLQTSRHLDALSIGERQYARFAVFSALESPEVLESPKVSESKRWQTLFSNLSDQGRADAIFALEQQIQGSGDSMTKFLREKAMPFLDERWPKERSCYGNKTRTAFAHLVARIKQDFPDVAEDLKDHYRKLDEPNLVIYALTNTQHPRDYPEATLDFLDTIIDRSRPPLNKDNLRNCLQKIGEAKSSLMSDSRFLDLYSLLEV